MKGKLYKSVKSREEIESSQLFSTMLQKVGNTGAVVIDGKNLMADSIYARHIQSKQITTDHLVVGVATADLINTGGLEITDELKVVHGDKDVLFINRDGVLEMNISALKIGLVDFEKDINTEIKAIAGSWSQLNLNNAGDIISGINANDKGTNIHGKNITLTGDTDVQGDFKVSGNQVVLNANTDIRGDFKVSGGSVILDANTDVKGDFKVDGNAIIDGTLSANKIRTGVISAASGTSTLNMDTGDMVMGGNFNLGNGALEWDKVTKTLDIRVNKLTIGQYPAASTKDIKDVDEKYKGQSLQDKGYIEGTETYTDKADDSVVHVEIDGKSVGGGSGKNLAVDSDKGWTSNGYNVVQGKLTEDWIVGETYTVAVKGRPSGSSFGLWRDTGYTMLTYLTYDSSRDVWVGTSTAAETPQDIKNNFSIYDMGYNDNGSYIDWIQIEKGTKSSEYEPPAPTPDYPIEIHSLNDFDVVSSVGKRNLIPNSDFSKSVTGPLFTVNGKTYNQYPESWNAYNGGISNPTTSYHAYLDSETFGFNTLVFNESNGVRDWKAINKNTNSIMNANDTEYVFSANVNTTKLGSKLFGGFHYFKKGGTVRAFHSGQFSVSPTAENQWQTISGKVPFPIDIDLTKSVSFFVYGFNFSSNSILYVRNIKLEVGNSPTPYSLSPEDTTESDNHVLIDKINLSLSEPLRSVGDIKDRLFRDIDGLWKIERNVGERVLKGTTGWSTDSLRYQGYNYAYFRPANFKTNGVVRSNILPYGSFTDNTRETLGRTSMIVFNLRDSRSGVSSSDSGSQRANKIRDYLFSIEGAMVSYELATPTTETLDQNLQDKLNSIRSFQNSNYVYTIINDKTDIISENLKPQIHTKFKGGGWYNRWKTSEAVNDIDAKINNAVTTIDGSGVTVKDGNFFLEDNSSSEKYSLKIKTNLITDHGIEFVSPTTAATNISGGATFNMAKEVYSGSHNNVYSHMPTGNIDIWSIGSPYLYISYLPNDFVNADYTPIFGATSGVVNNQNYFEAKVDSRISKNTTYTFSAHFKKHPNMTGSYPKIEVFQRKKQSTLEYRLASETFSYTSSNEDVIRYSVTFTTNNEFSTGMYFLRLRVTSSNSNYVMVDGLQLVEGNHPVQYHSEDTASFYQRDNRTQISGLQFDVRQLQSNKPIHSQGTAGQGKWIRFEDGMAIVEYYIRTIPGSSWTQWGSMWYLYLEYHWDFPIYFQNPPAVTGSLSTGAAFLMPTGVSNQRASSIAVYRPVNTGVWSTGQLVYLSAIGRWKN